METQATESEMMLEPEMMFLLKLSHEGKILYRVGSARTANELVTNLREYQSSLWTDQSSFWTVEIVFAMI